MPQDQKTPGPAKYFSAQLSTLRLSGQKIKHLLKIHSLTIKFYKNEKVNNYHDEPLLVGR
jgi:hypothetical protein